MLRNRSTFFYVLDSGSATQGCNEALFNGESVNSNLSIKNRTSYAPKKEIKAKKRETYLTVLSMNL